MSGEAEPLAVIRKKALLRILCRSEAARLGISVSEDEIRAEADRFRRHFTLDEADHFEHWLDENGLDPTSFANAMRDIVLVERIEEGLAEEVDALVTNQAALGTARLRLGMMR